MLQVGVNGLTLTQSGYRPAERLDRHAHEASYFSVVITGGYSERVGTSRRERAACSVAWHPSGEEHAEEFRPTRSQTLGVELSGAWAERLHAAGFALEAPRVWSGGPSSAIAMRLVRELARADGPSALAIEGLVLELAGESSRVAGTPRAAPAWLGKVVERLRATPGRAPSLAELAEQAGVHPVHLARTFRRHRGCTCGAFARRLRFEAARARLASSAASLSEIAHETGFSDQSHLTRCFKQESGLTPGEYRARLAGG